MTAKFLPIIFQQIMKSIQITNNQLAIVDDEDFEFLSKWKWYPHTSGYAVANTKELDTKKSLMHRLIMNPGQRMEVDHINGNKLDNRRINLRICTRAQNSRNTKSSGRSKKFHSQYKGVTIMNGRRKKWLAQIFSNGNRKSIGYFLTEIEAAKAYNAAAITLHGQFARLNEVA